MKNAIIFGRRMKDRRKILGISRKDFAKQIGVTYSTLSMYERGEKRINDYLKIKIAKELNLSLDYLMGIINSPLPINKNTRRIPLYTNLLDL